MCVIGSINIYGMHMCVALCTSHVNSAGTIGMHSMCNRVWLTLCIAVHSTHNLDWLAIVCKPGTCNTHIDAAHKM